MKITHIICTRNRAEQLGATRTPDAGQTSVETPSPKRAQGAKA
jgi:hypothetical protein